MKSILKIKHSIKKNIAAIESTNHYVAIVSLNKVNGYQTSNPMGKKIKSFENLIEWNSWKKKLWSFAVLSKTKQKMLVKLITTEKQTTKKCKYYMHEKNGNFKI